LCALLRPHPARANTDAAIAVHTRQSVDHWGANSPHHLWLRVSCSTNVCGVTQNIFSNCVICQKQLCNLQHMTKEDGLQQMCRGWVAAHVPRVSCTKCAKGGLHQMWQTTLVHVGNLEALPSTQTCPKQRWSCY
jgi:hypothetical protein